MLATRRLVRFSCVGSSLPLAIGVVMVAVLSTTALVGQGRAVVPSTAAFGDGRGAEPFLFGGFERRVQLVIDRRQLAAIGKQAIRSIAVRRDAATNRDLSAGLKGGWIDLTIRASWSNAAPDHPARTFRRNHASTSITVYAGPFLVPDAPQMSGGRTVASFAPGESVQIQLQEPIAWSAKGNLCLEFVARPHASRPAPGPWVADVIGKVSASRTVFGQSCWRKSHTDRAANRFLRDAAVGETLRSWTLGPETPLALFVLGASDRAWGPIPLPISLKGLGASGCSLYVSQDIVTLRQTVRRAPRPHATGSFAIQLPYVANLVGARLFSQWLFLDRNANAAGLSVTNGASVTVAASPHVGVSMVLADRASAKKGNVVVGSALALQLSR